MEQSKPHSLNVPGDYFVEDQCCMMCEVPVKTAPDLFGVILELPNSGHCFVKKQPETADEQDRMFLAIQRAEASCIIYRGHDRAVQDLLVEAGEGSICVDLPADLQHRSVEVQTARSVMFSSMAPVYKWQAEYEKMFPMDRQRLAAIVLSSWHRLLRLWRGKHD